ncbi:winged helix-turn-helix domain-containing protein [Pseudomonas sp. 7P_10.2_Bac1]|uniref:winged helix-turn-helix domain-containing protein n=1 Tax=Pseudomonas sp. 7P_10.2_Bac1 TaxID=2971614 RepID=UPI0021C92626|nr:winged helix-turn-helix domain-containing protein [Pseudomonas sp. 7P_10.2_Bac1]MCU1729602.1 winged helix-turn-helix domain-containing protein [Pseudomonas sp. 7P_10.2_Bac1]
MLLSGYKTNIPGASVLIFAQSEILINDIKKLISSDFLHLDASNPALSDTLCLKQVDAVFFEINTLNDIDSSIRCIEEIRKTNQSTCIFILVTHTKSFSSTQHYVSGADHCLKLPNDQRERRALLSQAIQESHWISPVQLHLDRTRLLLLSATRKIEITYTEMIIIDALVQAPEHVMSQDSIAKTLDPNIIFYDPRALEKTISRLRTKIKKTYNVELILSVRAHGYRLRRGSISI